MKNFTSTLLLVAFIIFSYSSKANEVTIIDNKATFILSDKLERSDEGGIELSFKSSDNVAFSADSITRKDNVTYLNGNVLITATDFEFKGKNATVATVDGKMTFFFK